MHSPFLARSGLKVARAASPRAQSLLCGIGRAGLDCGPWLTRLDADRRFAPLAAHIRRCFPDDVSAFWDRGSRAFRQFAAFALSGAADGA